MKFILLEDDNQNTLSYADMNWNSTDWKTIYNQLSNNIDREKLVDGFIDSFIKTKNIPQIKFRDSLKNLLIAGAPDSLDKYNPFMLWINSYNLKVRDIGSIDNDDFNSLINLHAQQVLLDEDLTGSSSLGTKSIIFNGDLFKQEEDNLNYLVKIFYWLDQSNNASKLFDHINSMDKRQQNQFCDELKTHPNSLNDIKNPEDLKYFFVFKSGKYSSMGQLKNAIDIQNSLNYLDKRVRYKGREEEQTQYTSKNPAFQTKEFEEKVKEIITGLTDKKQFNYKANQIRYVINDLIDKKSITPDIPVNALAQSVLDNLLKTVGNAK